MMPGVLATHALKVITEHVRRDGWAPTVQDLSKQLGISVHGAWRLLVELELAHCIVRERGARQIRVIRFEACPYCAPQDAAVTQDG